MTVTHSHPLSLFSKRKPVLIVTHQFPDVDGIGSCLALFLYLQNLSIPVTILSSDYSLEHFSFLPHSQHILTELPPNFSFSTLVVLDCSSLQRVKYYDELPISSTTTLINIDHHKDNDRFGHYNFVGEISSVGEYLCSFFMKLNCDISPDMATCLYSAISYDTGRFLYTNVTKETFSCASYLLNCGAKAVEINHAMYENFSTQTFEFIKVGLENLVLNESLGYAFTLINRHAPIVSYKIIDFIRQLGQFDIFIVFTELVNGYVKISLRSKQHFDVSLFSKQFGGGGHARASGILMKGSLSHVQRTICRSLEASLTPISYD